ncbi:MAG: hypothetical protein C4534_07030 [Gaiellales bacterium]|nr:MAG: hypothetical protein C4534_07030 [Gaiellales bacterium]
MDNRPQASEAQLAYAKLLDLGMKVGIVILLITFIIYIAGVMEPNVPVDKLPDYWEMKADEYVEVTGKATGWGWVKDLGKGDVLNSVGIAFLALVTIFCYLRVVPIMIRDKEIALLILILLEVAVLAAAASGFIKTGGH